MNYSGLPDLIAIGGLVAVFVMLSQRGEQARLRKWVLGWALVLVHFLSELVAQNVGFAPVSQAAWAFAVAALLLSSVAFVWAMDPASPGRYRWPTIVFLGALADVAFIVCLLYGSRSVTLFALLTLVGAGVSLAVYCRNRRRGEWRSQTGRASFLIAAYGAQLGLVLTGHFEAGLVWMLCWHYLAAAIMFRRGAPGATIGVVFTTLSFVAWALVFPVGLAVATWLPHVDVAPEIWNLPKYLVATGMLITLLQEQTSRFEYAALHDALTAIPNRRLLIRALNDAASRARHDGPGFALIFIDLDLFKSVNDSLGHAAGDRLLRLVADRLNQHMRRDDLLARIGGDEFAVLVPDVTDRDAVDGIARKLTGLLSEPFELGGNHYLIGASVGYALAPAEGGDTETLYALADRRMYDDKQAGRRRPQRSGSAAPLPDMASTVTDA